MFRRGYVVGAREALKQPLLFVNFFHGLVWGLYLIRTRSEFYFIFFELLEDIT